MIRVFNRFELQTWMIRIVRANTNRFLYFGIQSVIRQMLYAVSWVLEGLGIAAHQEVARYHVHRATGTDLDDHLKDIGLEVGKKGSYARGKIRLQAKPDAPESFSVDATELLVVITVKQKTVSPVAPKTLRYTVATLDQIYFSKKTSPQDTIGAYAIVDYIAELIGSDHNIAQDEILKAELAAPHQHIESVTLTGNGMTGGTEADYTPAEKLQQYVDYYSGLAKGNDSALKFTARTIAGVQYADVGHADPVPGETTIYIADKNGLTNNHVLEQVKQACEPIRAAGITANYKEAKRYLLYVQIQVHSAMRIKINTIIRQHVDEQGFRPNINVYNAFKTEDPECRINQLRYRLISPIETVQGVYIIGASKNWTENILRWNASEKTMSFADGKPVSINENKDVYTIVGTELDVFIIVKVNTSELSGYSSQETLLQRHYMDKLEAEFNAGDIVRLATDGHAIVED